MRAKYYKLFFKGVDFMITDYNNGLAEFTSEIVQDEEEASFYKVICSIADNCLGIVDDEYHDEEGVYYTIQDIFDRCEKVNEITQHELVAFKVDTLFNNTMKDEEEIQRD